MRAAEAAIDVLRLDGAMNTAKDDIHQAIQAELRRAARRHLLLRVPFRLQITRGMVAPLERLFRLGRDEAQAELRRAGYQPARPPSGRKYEDAPVHYHSLDKLRHRIRAGLDQVEQHASRDLVQADLGDLSATLIARALMNTPGGRDLASRVVSTALYSGLGLTFEENEGLVAGWERTAVLDSGTCPPCDESDGTEYDTWADATLDLPDGGPALNCEGGARCRCRLVPRPA